MRYEVDQICPVCDQPVVHTTAHTLSTSSGLVYTHAECCVVCSAADNATGISTGTVPRSTSNERATVDA